MNPFFFHSTGENLHDQSDKDTLAITEFSHGTNEGSEFLDDAIRMKDLPLNFSEEN